MLFGKGRIDLHRREGMVRCGRNGYADTTAENGFNMAAPSEKREAGDSGMDTDDVCPPVGLHITSLDTLKNKIKQILQSLLENSLPGDDTFLEKLVTMIKTLKLNPLSVSHPVPGSPELDSKYVDL